MKSQASKITIRKSARLIAGVLALQGVAFSPQAATRTWNGGSAPVAYDSLVFSGMARPNPVNDFASGTIFDNLAFDVGAQLPFTLGGNRIALLYASDASLGTTGGGSIANASFQDQTVTLPIELLTGKHTIATLAGAGNLNLNGPIYRSTGALVVFDQSGGFLCLTGSGLTNRNGILGGWAITGNDWAALDDVFIVIPCDSYIPVLAGAIAGDPASNVKYANDTGDISANNVTTNSLLTQQAASRSLTVTY